MSSNDDNPGSSKIPAIAGSLKLLFILRAIISLAMIMAGVVIFSNGSDMLMASVGTGAETVLIQMGESFKITASGFGAVVMVASIIPFYLAYRSRPTLTIKPAASGQESTSNGEGASDEQTALNESTEDVVDRSYDLTDRRPSESVKYLRQFAEAA